MQIDSGNLALKGLDDLFSTEENRQEEQREQVQQIPIDELHPFTNHPFKVVDDEAMTRTVESIAQFGVLAPLIARPRPDGDGYEIISGHRRQFAAKMAGLETLPVIVRDMDDDAATILMVDSNLQREHISPSERAFAYKMKLDALKNQGARSDLTSPQIAAKFRSDDAVAKSQGVSGDTVQRYVRLTNLIPELLNMVDEKKVSFNPAVELSYLSAEQQQDMFNMDGASKFHFDWKDLVKSGLSVKDAIAPTAFAFKNSRTFQMGGIYCAASFLSITASDISDQLLKDFLDMDSSQIVTMHIQSVDQNKAIKTVKRTITELDRSKIEEQKKAIRAGYDIDIIPSDLATYGRDAKALLKELQSQNERMFLVTFLVLNTGRTEQELENNVFQASSIAQKHNCNLCRLDFQQEQGLMSSLPLADCQIEIQRGLTTSSTAIFIPFTTQELYQSGKESLYYGLNALSNNLIMVDRKKLKNPNGLILGTPGSGKSFSAKREITNAFLVTDDDIIICDPEAEYAPLVERLHGQVIHIGPASTQYINPMDINSNYSEEDNPLALKADFILSLCELVVGGKEGLQPVEKTVIDRCVHVVYRKYFENPTPENMPLLEDLYNALLTQDEPEARHVAAALEIYVKGSLNIFNHHTNVDIHNRIVCFDIKQLGKQLKKLGMLIVQDAVWGRVTANRSAGKSTRYYADEFHLLLKEEQTAAYSVEIWKRFRKWGGIPTALTQNVKDLLASPEVSNIFENSDFVYMLNQANGDRQILAKQLNISPHQLSYVTHSGEGEGLLFFGNVILPFVDHFPKDLELYRILTTKLNEISEGTQK